MSKNSKQRSKAVVAKAMTSERQSRRASTSYYEKRSKRRAKT